MPRYIETVKRVLTQPAPFFRGMKREGGLGAPLVYAIIGLVIGSLGSFLASAMTPFGGVSLFGDGGGGLVLGLLLLPIFAVIGLFIGSGILHVLLLLVASSRQPFETTFRVMAYTMGSTSPLNIIPFVGGFVSAIWGLIVLVLASAEAHEVPQAKAAIAVLLPAVLCCGVALLFGGALIALLFGAAAAGLRS